MEIKSAIRTSWKVLFAPQESFARIKDMTLESVLGTYLKLLLMNGILTYIFISLFYVGRATYWNLTRGVDVSYLFLINFSLGNSTSLLFLTFFIGTVIMFLLTSILHTWFKKVKFSLFIKIVCFAASPLLFFGWIFALLPGLIIWSIVLFIIGINEYEGKNYTKKDSIENRD